MISKSPFLFYIGSPESRDRLRDRDRRIGEFLKELNLTEGRGTGIPKILRAIQKNGSPLPVFETDDDRTYFVARFPIHPGALQRITKKDSVETEEPGTKSAPSWHQVGTKLGLEPAEILKVLNLCKDTPKLKDLMEAFSWSDRTKLTKRRPSGSSTLCRSVILSKCATTGLKGWIGNHAAGSWIRPASWKRCGRGGKQAGIE